MKMSWTKNILLDLLYDIAGSLFYAVGVYTFAKTADFAPGGLTGLALIMNHLWRFPIGITSITLNIPFIVFTLGILGRSFIIKTLKSMCFCTIFLDVIFPHFPVYSGSRFLSALYSGIFLGIGLALFYMRGSSSGGTDFITMSVKKLHPHFSIGVVTLITDLVIILLGWPVFGDVDAVLYGITSTLLCSLVIDKTIYGMGSGTLLIIITDQGEKVGEEINRIIGRGSTELKGRGTYTDEPRDVILCACSKSQTYMIRTLVQEIDQSSFVMITETSEVFGEGFYNSSGKTIDTRKKK